MSGRYDEEIWVTTEGGRRLHACVAGRGRVTVMFEAGLGKARTTWAGVQPAVAGFARTVTYDRAGLGRSDPVGDRRRVTDLARDHATVRTELCGDRCVVVGHSYGGPIARLAAVKQPEGVCGAVLVDEVTELSGAITEGSAMRGAGLYHRMRLGLARRHLLARRASIRHRRLLASGDPAIDPDAVVEAIAAVEAEDGAVGPARTAVDEWAGFLDSVRGLRDTGPWVPRVPVVTISPERVGPDRRDLDDIGRAQGAIADLAPEGRHVYVPTTDHFVHLAEPGAVIDEIRAMVDRVGSPA